MDGSGDLCCVQFGQGVGITSRIIKESLKKKKKRATERLQESVVWKRKGLAVNCLHSFVVMCLCKW